MPQIQNIKTEIDLYRRYRHVYLVTITASEEKTDVAVKQGASAHSATKRAKRLERAGSHIFT